MKLSMTIAAILALVAVGTDSPAIAGGPPELSAPELAMLQSRRYQVPAKVAFSAVLGTLQTLGYVDVNASKDAGTISAVTEAKAKTILNIFWGFGKKKWTQKASVLVEDEGPGSRVRLNMVLSETKARGIFGTSFTDGKIVRIAGPYQDFFAALDAEMAQRGGAVTSASVGASVDATGAIDLGGGVRLAPAKTLSGYCIKAAAGYVGTGSVSKPAATEARPVCT